MLSIKILLHFGSDISTMGIWVFLMITFLNMCTRAHIKQLVIYRSQQEFLTLQWLFTIKTWAAGNLRPRSDTHDLIQAQAQQQVDVCTILLYIPKNDRFWKNFSQMAKSEYLKNKKKEPLANKSSRFGQVNMYNQLFTKFSLGKK